MLDLVFEIRPLFTGPIPDGMERCGPLQDEVMAAAADLRELLPGEKGSGRNRRQINGAQQCRPQAACALRRTAAGSRYDRRCPSGPDDLRILRSQRR